MKRIEQLANHFKVLSTTEVTPEPIFSSLPKIKKVDIKPEYDYIIVGGGTAGCVIASRLSEDPNVNVLLLEAGPTENIPEITTPARSFEVRFQPIDWQFVTEKQPELDDRSIFWPSGRVLGGSSSLNLLTYVRGHAEDFDWWEKHAGCEGWGYQEMLKYFLKSENSQMENVETKYHSNKGLLGVSKSNYVNPLTTDFLNANNQKGLPILNDYNASNQHGVAISQNTIFNGERVNSSSAFLKNVSQRSNLTIANGVHVTKILIKDNQAKGVRFSRGSLNFSILQQGRQEIVKAKREVIISAGTVGSAWLLMLSGIGPKEHLEGLGISVIKDLSVGRNLQDHIGVLQMFKSSDLAAGNSENFPILKTLFETARYALTKTGLLVSSVFEAFAFLQSGIRKDLGTRPDLQISFFPSIVASYYIIRALSLQNHGLFKTPHLLPLHGISFVPTLLHPSSQGEIKLISSDPFTRPMVNPNYLADPLDLQVLVSGMKYCRELVKEKPLNHKITNEIIDKSIPFDSRSDSYLEEYVRKTCVSLGSYAGSCKMGAISDPTTVVDSRLRVKDIRGLRVADCSIVPLLPSGGTGALAIAIGEKASDLIIIDNK